MMVTEITILERSGEIGARVQETGDLMIVKSSNKIKSVRRLVSVEMQLLAKEEEPRKMESIQESWLVLLVKRVKLSVVQIWLSNNNCWLLCWLN